MTDEFLDGLPDPVAKAVERITDRAGSWDSGGSTVAEQNVLIGKTITNLMIADDKKALRFQTTDGDIVVLVDGDCCSESWVEFIELPALGFPAVVSDVDDLDLPGSNDNDPEHDCLAVYGLKITTNHGHIIIDYRNSNGYYGGNLVWPGEHCYGGVYHQNVSSLNWIEV